NYLGLTTHPSLERAMIKATEEWGAGSGAVRTIAGTMTIHEELERRLADFKHTEACLTLQSGYATNLGILSCVLVEGDVVISDELNHASIIDGIRLTKADRLVYKHADLDSLEAALGQAGRYRRKLIVTDGVFSMDGDIAPLPGIVERAEHHEAMVMVDDAHASGVLGQNGRGSVNHFGLDGRVNIQVGTLSKAMGVLGGYAAGSAALREYLVAKARPFLFSTSHPPGVAAACIAAIDVLLDEPDRIERLWANTRYFKAQLAALGFDTGVSETPITPVIAGDPERANKLSDALSDGGIFAQPIVFPMVRREQSRIRTIVTSEHTRAQLDATLEVFESAGRRLGLIA
ncbi:MAG TPA: aminotransferase class I/II-fold pyridoxal phosphate-dependent enzyme, partial [Candidatus Dormibacteraeota bacterium]|nr:aminotransferase class I/II-fold pyridoxal phosphate-dependent enzyme [Candidatus Dormibacteraeota bacterium]